MTNINQETSKPVELDEPIKRGEQIVDTITLRRPKAGELRGLSLVDLAQMDVVSLQRVLPRISVPTLSEADVAAMCPADLLALAVELAGFFQRKADRFVSQAE